MARAAAVAVAGHAPASARPRPSWRPQLDSHCADRLGAPMASPMIPPAQAPDFLAAHGWAGAQIRPLAGDASFRRYFRVHRDGETAVLMDAPPPHEDPRPFVAVAEWLAHAGLSAPRILAADYEQGLLLLDDFGDRRLRETLDES